MVSSPALLARVTFTSSYADFSVRVVVLFDGAVRVSFSRGCSKAKEFDPVVAPTCGEDGCCTVASLLGEQAVTRQATKTKQQREVCQGFVMTPEVFWITS
jgi:hypothetical protein